jgi:heme-degrading monooxygenase HmoA
MFVVCNRIPVAKGHEAEFERLFLERNDSQSRQPLSTFPGFIRNDILRPKKEEPYVVLTYWNTLEDFEAWTNSQSFQEAHRGRGRSEIFAGHPNLEIHEVIKSTVAKGSAV